MDAERACAALVAKVGEIAPGLRCIARQVSAHLWSVGIVDEADQPAYIGAGYLVGTDGRLWQVSSNPGIHDWTLAQTLLQRVYSEGVQDRLSDEFFATRLRQATEGREAMIREFVSDVRGGNALGEERGALP